MLFPIQCQACKGTFHVAKITDDLRCGCGSDDLDLWVEADKDEYADQRAHDVSWMTAQERNDLDKELEKKPEPKEAAALFNKRHYEHIADTIRSAPVDDETRSRLADHFTESMRGTNPAFEPEGFRSRAVSDDYSPKTRRRVGRTAAVGSGPGYYILSNGVAVAGPFASTSLAHDALPGQHGNAVQWLGDKDRVKDLSETDAFPNPGGYDSSATDLEMGFAGGGTMGGIWGGGLGMWAKRYAKIREITRGIQETNPGLPRKEARRVAKDTVERFPGMVAQ